MRSVIKVAVIAVAVVALPAGSGTLEAGDSAFMDNFGGSFFAVDKPCPLKQFPTFESLVPVPQIIDPFDQDLIPMFCQVQVRNKNNPKKGARGKFETELIVIDNISGMAESFPIKSGKFKTNSDGFSSFDFELPAELFADGFESGDVSAWSYTRTDFTRKKGTSAQVSCDAGTSRSN